jgi:uncharacterized membrane protein YvlD (DUF360 family)
MNRILKLSLSRGGRFLTSYALAFALWIIAGKLSGLQVPEYLTPVIAAVINAIGKYIRETLKLRVPF